MELFTDCLDCLFEFVVLNERKRIPKRSLNELNGEKTDLFLYKRKKTFPSKYTNAVRTKTSPTPPF